MAECLGLPDHTQKLAIVIDGLEVSAVRGDEAGSMGACGEGDEDVEVKIAGLARREAVIGANLAIISGPIRSKFFPVGVRMGWLFPKVRRKSRSAVRVAPRHNSARTTDDVRTKPCTDSMRLR